MPDSLYPPPDVESVDRRAGVVRSALTTFARFGYRRTSMDQVAQDAGISRPGLYFLFASKQALFQEAVECALQQDLSAVQHALANADGTFRRRLLNAFDCWAGRYIGPLTREIAAVVEDNPALLGPVAKAAPGSFARLITEALVKEIGAAAAERVARTLISTSIGIKHQVKDRQTYLEWLDVAIELLVSGGGQAP